MSEYYCPRCNSYDHATPEACCRCAGSGLTCDGHWCSCPVGLAMSDLESLKFYRTIRGLKAKHVMSPEQQEASGVADGE